ncbi:GNAT family N-acetyltransferase [uncultured Tenacibaculum sp.]|uniref:GNAT family N-acetyltransferase n=1 Tax=uncultured Tenacibaculum sp. TaxID=174713 RepID=UPI002632864C|nr:GNAT family N-acetyltransferase [uncultured Tenacibaculum sp.]
MISITEHIQLKEISNNDSESLFKLMQEVYTAAYKHFWKDSGVWYINAQYSKENIAKELEEENTAYYFVVFKNEIVGNFRIIWNKELVGFEGKKSVKLHRIYLHAKTQGNGVGKALLNWLEETTIKKQYELIWLDAMDEKPQAFEFYKKRGYEYNSHCFLDFELLHDELRKMSQLYKLLS